MKYIKLMDVNGTQKELIISPAFIQIIEDANSMYCSNARSRVITNILNNDGKKITYLVKETPNEIYEALKREGINLLNFTCVNGRHKNVFMKHSLVVAVEHYNSIYLANAHSKIRTNLSDNNGKMIEYIVLDTKEEINNKIMQIPKR